MKQMFLGIALSLGLFVHSAQAVTLNPVDTGVFTRTSTTIGLAAGTSVSHDSNATAINFQFLFGGSVFVNQHAFAIFDLSGLSAAVTGASIEMSLTANNIALGGPGSFVFNQVDSDPALFNSSYDERSNCFPLPVCTPLGTGSDIHNDLGNGPALGTVAYTDVGTQTAALDTTGVDLINLALGGLFVVGIDSAGNNGIGRLDFAAPQLTLELAPVPIPAALWLFGSALFGFLGYARHRDQLRR